MNAEDKILGRKMPEAEPQKPVDDVFASGRVWLVEKDGCGQSALDGRMVYEMLDADGKKAAKNGAKQLRCNGFKFKLAK